MAISSRGSLESGRAGQSEPASVALDPVSSGRFTPLPQHGDVAFVAPAAAPLVVVYLAVKLAEARNGSAQSGRTRTVQLQKDFLAELRRVPGVTPARYESIKSDLHKALNGGATAFAGFVSRLKSELMGQTSGQRFMPSSSAPPTSATPLPRRAASPAVAPAVDPAVAKAQRLVASTVECDRVYAPAGAQIGSFGAMLTWPDAQEFRKKWGLVGRNYSSRAHKEITSPNRIPSEADTAEIHSLLADLDSQFVEIVRRSRPGMTDAQFSRLADGWMLTGATASAIGLVDEIGGLDAAFANLHSRGLMTGSTPAEDLVYIGNPNPCYERSIPGSQFLSMLQRLIQ